MTARKSSAFVMLLPTWEQAGKALSGLFALLIIAIIGFLAFNAAPSLNKEERRFCNYSRICTKYASSRQDCAIAGDFEKCIGIKMGGDTLFVDYCTDGGEVKSEVKSDLIKNATTFSWPSRRACVWSELFSH
jgi:hypothetical protein